MTHCFSTGFFKVHILACLQERENFPTFFFRPQFYIFLVYRETLSTMLLHITVLKDWLLSRNWFPKFAIDIHTAVLRLFDQLYIKLGKGTRNMSHTTSSSHMFWFFVNLLCMCVFKWLKECIKSTPSHARALKSWVSKAWHFATLSLIASYETGYSMIIGNYFNPFQASFC